MMQKKFSRSIDELANIVAMTDDFFGQNSINPAVRNTIDLAIEELFVNMVNYNLDTVESILIELTPIENGVEASLTDYDVDRFDPMMFKMPDVDAPLSERTPGGLGLFLVIKMVDSINYSYKNRQSKITLTRVEPNV